MKLGKNNTTLGKIAGFWEKVVQFLGKLGKFHVIFQPNRIKIGSINWTQFCLEKKP